MSYYNPLSMMVQQVHSWGADNWLKLTLTAIAEIAAELKLDPHQVPPQAVLIIALERLKGAKQ